MENPALVAYLRKHLKRFGADALRDKLIEEGVPEEAVEEAITQTLRGRSRGRKVLPLLFLAALVGIALLWLSLERKEEPRQIPPQNRASLSTSPSGAFGKVFMGHYGYVLQLPEAYRTLSEFKDLQKTREVVYIFPEGTDPANLLNEGLYAALRILKLEVSPRETVRGKVTADSLRAIVFSSFAQQKPAPVSRDINVSGLPGFLISTTAPYSQVRAFLVGTRVIYILTGSTEQGIFNEVLSSLHEVSQEPFAGSP